MNVLSVEETMTRRMHINGIAAVVTSFIAVLLGILGYVQWFYALGLLSLSFLFACLFYGAKSLRTANVFHALRMIFGSLFVAYVLVQFVFIFI